MPRHIHPTIRSPGVANRSVIKERAGKGLDGCDGRRRLRSDTTPEGRQTNRRSEIVAVGESVENIGGTSLGDRLQEGFANFMKDPMGALKNVFGG